MFLYAEKCQRNKCAVSERMGYGVGMKMTKQVKEKSSGSGKSFWRREEFIWLLKDVRHVDRCLGVEWGLQNR